MIRLCNRSVSCSLRRLESGDTYCVLHGYLFISRTSVVRWLDEQGIKVCDVAANVLTSGVISGAAAGFVRENPGRKLNGVIID